MGKRETVNLQMREVSYQIQTLIFGLNEMQSKTQTIVAPLKMRRDDFIQSFGTV